MTSQMDSGGGAGGAGGGVLSFAVVRSWRAAPVEGAATRLHTHVTTFSQAGEDFAAGARMPSCQGITATAAATRREALLEQARRHVATATTVYQALGDAADDLTGLEARVRAVEATAASSHLGIRDDGSVVDLLPPPATTALTTAPGPVQQAAATAAAAAATAARDAAVNSLQAQIRQILTDAAAIDARLTNALRHGLAGTDDGDATTMAQARAAGSNALVTALAESGYSAVPSTPEDVKTFWSSVSPGRRQLLLAEDPGRWGNLDGIPTSDRNTANRASLRQDLADGQAMFTAHLLKAPASLQALDELSNRDKALVDPAGLQRYRNAVTINAQLSDHDGDAPLFLHTYQAGAYGGDGRGAIAFDNPDTATNLAVLTPGFTSRVDSIGAVTNDAATLYQSANRKTPGQHTAVLGWIGYDAPDTSSWTQKTAVATQDKATTGAKELASAVRGLRANFTGTGKITAIGHSYGSTTTALALQNQHLADHVDQVVLIGSPGVGGNAHTATDLGLDKNRLFIGSASQDKVTTALDALGDNPAYDTFGATRFRAENIDRGHIGAGDWYKSNPLGTLSDLAIGDHTAYFDKNTGSEPLASMTYITTGQADQLGPHHLVAEPRTRIHTVIGSTPVTYENDPEADRTPERDLTPWMTTPARSPR